MNMMTTETRGARSLDQWNALGDAGDVLAGLAGIRASTTSNAGNPAVLGEFADALICADGERRQAIDAGIADISAFMEPGISALLSVMARGADVRPAARALWQEFAASRDGLVVLALSRK